MMLFLLMLLVLLWTFQVAFFEQIYTAVKKSEMYRAADFIEDNSNLNNEQIKAATEQIAKNYDLCVTLLEVQRYNEYISGFVLSKSHNRLDCVIDSMSVNELLMLSLSAIQNGGDRLATMPRNIRYLSYYVNDYRGNLPTDDSGMGTGIIYTRIVGSDVRNGDIAIVLNTTTSSVNSTVRTLRTELLIISVIMTIAALILSFLLAKQVAKPIIRINSGAKLLAEGNYDVRFKVDGYREITELSDTLSYAAQELSKTGALQRELIANISHDLRTPLTMIEGYAEMMRDIPGENTPENMQIIIDETKRLSSLVNDVLDISRLQSGTQQLKLEEFNLTETIREVIGRFSKLTEQDGWVINFDSSEEVMVNADRTRILQVVYNFINNAITHSGADKVVIVEQRVIMRGNKQVVRIEVTDHGEGIAKENIPYIWDRYYKVDKLHKRAQTGSGLGLSIVKSILELHNADYGVESELGKGATFWFEM
ncbi:MAG: HAMP domain-containing histidine kinase [Clostridiales bacterium]|nr:HAMP domain-containing histidine kinase [Clostridiales bacterium]